MTSYRDDLAAALSRAEAAEKQALVLQKRVDALENHKAGGSPVQPARFTVSEQGETTDVQWRWYRPREHKFMLLWCAFWDLLTLGITISTLVVGDPIMLLFMIPFLVVGFFTTKATLAGVLNTSTLAITPHKIVVAHHPIHWRCKDVEVTTDTIRDVVIDERVIRLNQTHVPRFDLSIVDKNGERIRIANALHTEEEAAYLEDLVKRRIHRV